MNRKSFVLGVALTVAGVVVGYGIARLGGQVGEVTASSEQAMASTVANAKKERRVLYWYDPMVPDQHFDKPGKSPFMDMELQPKYEEEDDDSGRPGLALSASVAQTLGLRYATAVRREIASAFDAPGMTQLDASEVAVVQARTGGFVRRVMARTPGEAVRAGTPLLEIVAPEWTGAQQEFLAIARGGDASLMAASRQRLLYLGMPESLVKRLEQSRNVQPAIIEIPIDGVLQELSVRDGMTVSAGTPLATINGTSRVWVEVAVPEIRAGQVKAGQGVTVSLPSQSGAPVQGVVKSVLVEGNTELRTLRVRIVLPNRDSRLQAGLTAIARFRGPSKRAVVVPAEAVIRTGTRDIVYIVGSDDRLRPVVVQTGMESGNDIAIENGIDEGQRVVTSGQFLIDSESSLRGILPTDTEAQGDEPVMAMPADAPAPEPVPAAHAGHGGM